LPPQRRVEPQRLGRADRRRRRFLLEEVAQRAAQRLLLPGEVQVHFGRQNVASSPAVATTATPSAIPPPAQPVIAVPAAESTENRPGPSTASARQVTDSTRTYS